MSIRRNTAYNLLGALVPLAVSLVTIPIYLGLIGEARYGVLAIAWLLLGYFGLFDLGLGRATAQRIAALHDASAAERAEIFWTALAMNLGLGIVGGLVLWPVATLFFSYVLKVDEALRPELLATIPWLMLAVPVATVSSVLGGALQGRERFLELNGVSVLGGVLVQLLPLAIAASGTVHLAVLLAAALLARVSTLLPLFWSCNRSLARGHPVVFLRHRAGELLRFGGWVTVTAFVGPMMVILDRFIIGATSGAKAVTHYTVPFSLAERTALLSSALTSALFPRFASLDRVAELQLAGEGLRALVLVMTPLAAVGIFFIEPFLSWWISPAFSERSALVGQILLLGYWLNSFARIPFAQLQARGRPDIVAKCHLAELLPYFALLYLGLHYLGLAGAAMAFSLRVLVDYVLLSGIAGVLRQSLRTIVLPGALVAAAGLIATQLDRGSPAWMPAVGTHLFLTFVWARWLALPGLRLARTEATPIAKQRNDSSTLRMRA